MKHLEKTSNALLAFVLAFSFCLIAPSNAMAEGPDLAAGSAKGVTTGAEEAEHD